MPFLRLSRARVSLLWVLKAAAAAHRPSSLNELLRRKVAPAISRPLRGCCLTVVAYIHTSRRTAKAALAAVLILKAMCARAAESAEAPAQPAQQPWRVDYQLTNVTQWHSRFRSPYEGANSLPSRSRAEETTDFTVYLGRRLGPRTELWVNPEVDQGFGLRNTVGVAGFPSGAAYKVGQNEPYLRLPRAFIRHTVDLSGERERVPAAANQFELERAADNVVFTVGKFAVVDVFDTNAYAHDPRLDFLNWSVLEGGAFDYAADSWGYTFGASAELNTGAWSWRAGVFTLSNEPNAKVTGVHPNQRAWITEAEHRYDLAGLPGKIKFLVFANRGKMAGYDEANGLGIRTGQQPDASLVRRYQTNPGWVLGMEQKISSDLGAFTRLSANSGKVEAFEFTEINRSVTAGISLKGSSWRRAQDTVGAAATANALSAPARRYFAAGGVGILIGDGQLHYAGERIVELYYSARLLQHTAASFDVQRIWNPAYNADRGPVWVYATRLHFDF